MIFVGKERVSVVPTFTLQLTEGDLIFPQHKPSFQIYVIDLAMHTPETAK